MKKSLYATLALLAINVTSLACEVCSRQNSWWTRFAHGTGPQSQWDYVIVAATVAIVVITLWSMIAALVKPGENAANHIKQTILNEPLHE